jgi:hypothetical protein
MNYMEVDDADEYFSETVQDVLWSTLDDDQKLALLTSATQTIDSVQYKGVPETETNEFPRTNQIEVPLRVKQACAEEAYALAQGIDVDQELESLRTKSHGIASVRTSYDTSMVVDHKQAGFASRRAFDLLRIYLIDPHEITMIRVS